MLAPCVYTTGNCEKVIYHVKDLFCKLAGVEGVEPPLIVSETTVLPLHQTPKNDALETEGIGQN
jgi:hypothetical protein